MTLSLDRRNVVRALLGATGGLLVPRWTSADPLSTDSSIAVTHLSANVAQIAAARGNVVVLEQPAGLLVVNGGLPEHSAALLDVIRETFPAKPIQRLFNTDWHREHVGLNEAAGSAGAKIVAHENTKLWLDADVYVKWQDRTYKALPGRALPNETFYTVEKKTFGSEPIVYGYLGQAHTDGDIYVYLPGPNILIAGDVVTVGSYPILDYSTGGWIGGMVGAARTLLGVANADTRIVPGVGPVQTRAHLQAEQDMLSTMRDRLVKLLKSGLSIDEMLAAAPTKEFDSVWGNADLFIRNAYPGMWGHARELGGVI